MITIQHHYGKTFLAKSIRFFSRGNFNHTSILIDNYIYESYIDTGVTKTKLKDWKPRSKIVATHTFKTKNKIQLMKWLDMQVGKKYDTLGVFSFIFPLLPERKGYWYCSELAIVVLQKAVGVKIHNNKKSPQDIFDICELLQGIKLTN